MPKKGGSGSRKSVRVEEKAALEAEQAAAVVDAQTAAKAAGTYVFLPFSTNVFF